MNFMYNETIELSAFNITDGCKEWYPSRIASSTAFADEALTIECHPKRGDPLYQPNANDLSETWMSR